jgi:putative transposase
MTQHLIVCGNNLTEIFCAAEDFQFYLKKLQLACNKHGCQIHAYVLMTNHLHLLVPRKKCRVSAEPCKCWGAITFSYTYHRTGTLQEGRYKATLIDFEAFLLTCMRNIELNPARAGM